MSVTVEEIIISCFILFGSALVLIGAIGLYRLPDVYMRLHAPAKATTLGLGSVLLASIIYFSLRGPGLSLHEILITVFLFITAPVSGHLIAKAAIGLKVPTRSTGIIPEETSDAETETTSGAVP